jgi:hypothetical protein
MNETHIYTSKRGVEESPIHLFPPIINVISKKSCNCFSKDGHRQRRN